MPYENIVLILILMEYSLINWQTDDNLAYCLNPYSNGILPDTLSESTLRFQPFTFPNNFPFKIRELIQLELYFRKCTHSEHTFQIKKSIF